MERTKKLHYNITLNKQYRLDKILIILFDICLTIIKMIFMLIKNEGIKKEYVFVNFLCLAILNYKSRWDSKNVNKI
jgi:uncharacterized membrane protein